MSNIKINIWNRNFELPLYYECYEDQKVLESQHSAAEAFINHADTLCSDSTAVKNYVADDASDRIEGSIDNIFKYVMPNSVYVLRDGDAAIICDYKFDPEHGLAVTFDDGKLKSIGSEDSIL